MAVAAVALAVFAFTSAASAQSTEIWTTGAGDGTGDWSAAGNWTGTNLPPISGDSLTFGATAGTTTLNDDLTNSSFNIGTITFNSGSPAYTMTGNAFTLTGGITDNATSTETINDAINMTAVQTLTIASGGKLALGGNLTGAGGLTLAGSGAVVLSGSNSSFQGGIFNNTYSNTLTLNGASSGGTGNITFKDTNGGQQTSYIVNLFSDISATFTPASVNFNNGFNYNNSLAQINIGPITNGVTGKTLTLNSVSPPNEQDGNGFLFTSTAGSGYTLNITTLSLGGGGFLPTVRANTTLAIGTMTWNNTFGGGNTVPVLGGTVGGSVATATDTGGSSDGGISVTSGTWTFTGANSYGSGQWTNNGNGYGSQGTKISGSSTVLAIAQDLSLGTVPGSTITNNVGLVSGGTLRASASFTLNSKRGIGIGSNTGSAGDTGTIDVASGQTLTYNGIIASSGASGAMNLITTPSGGTLILGGPNTYNGTTTVNAGTLLANATLTTGTGAVNVGGTGTLGGTGTIKGAVNVSGSGTLGGALTIQSPVALTGSAMLSPGAITGVGNLTVSNSLSLGSGAASNFYIAGVTGSGPNNSNITINGNSVLGATSITYGGALNIAFASGVTNSIFTATSGNTYTFQLFPSGVSESGTFSSFNLPALGTNTYKWSNFDYVHGDIQVIPVVPATQPQYTLAIVPTTLNAHAGATVPLTTTIANFGGGSSSDSFSFTGLGATLTGGTGGTIGGPTSGGSGSMLGYNGSVSTTGLTYTNSTAGTYTLTASVGSATGDNASGNYSPANAVLNGTAGTATITLYTGQSNWTNSSSGNWSSYANWDAGGTPGIYASNPTGDSATFGTQSSGSITVTVDDNPSITTLNLNSTSTSYTIGASGAGSLTMNNTTGLQAAINVTGTHAISAPVALTASTTVTTVSSTDALTISGAISGSGNGGSTLRVNGPGTVTLTGPNTYTNGTAISSGATLRIGNNGVAGSLGSGDVANTGTLIFNRSDAALVVSNNITNAGGSGGVVTQSGSGTTILSGANSYDGGTNVNAGTLEFAVFASQPTSGTVTVASGATLAVGAGGPGWTSAQIDGLRTTAPTGASFASGAILGIDTTNASGGSFTYGSNITDTNSSANSLGVAKIGTGTLVLGGTNSFTGGLFINSGTVAASSNANLGPAAGSITFNGGTLQFNSGFATGSTRTITLNVGGGTINPNGNTAMVAGNISGPGGLTLVGNGTVVLSGNNSFQGGIFNNTTSNTLTLNGASSGGTGNITYGQNPNNTNNTVNLLSDTSDTFSVASLNFNSPENYTNSFSTINVGPITNGVIGKTLTLNSVTSPNDQGNNSGSGFVFSSAPGSGYTLGITTLNLASNNANNNPITANTNVAIGALNWTDQFDYGTPTLTGSVGGSVGTATNLAGAIGGLNITSGTWTFTGANSYGAGPWTNNGVHNAGTGGTQINGASTTLVINNDLALGAVPSSAVNNIGLVAGGTLRADASFTLNSKRGIGIGPVSGTSTYTGTLDVALNQTLIYNGIIASSGNSGTNNLITTPSGGTLVLGGPNTYNGTTTVAGGTLRAAYPTSSLTASSTGTGNVMLNGGVLSSTAGTTSYILGSVLGGTGAHTIAPGGDGTIGTLAVGGLTPNNLSTLKFDITSPTSLDQISDSGALGFSGSGAAMVEVPTTLTDNTYKLIGFGSLGMGVSTADFSLASLSGGSVPGGYRLSLASNELDLIVNTVTDQWTNNANNGVWDIGMTQNWAATAAPTIPTTYADGNSVLFNDTNPLTGNPFGSAQAINIASNVAPFNVTFTNHSIDYTVGGAAIGGNTSVVVNGGGNVTLTGQNTFSGGAIITNGTLRLGASSTPTSGSVTSGPVGTAAVQLGDISGTNNASLVWAAGSSGLSLANNITVVAGSSGNTLTIGGMNTSGTNTFSGNITLNNSATVSQAAGSGTLAFTGNITPGASSTLTFAPGAGATITAGGTGVIGGGTGTLAVTQNGAGTTILSGANTYSGMTSVTTGTLRVTGSLGGTGAVNVAVGATLGGGAGPTTGSIAGLVTVGGHLAPNGLTGMVNNLTLSGGLALSNNAFLDYQLGNPAVPTTSDLVTLGNGTSLTLGSNVTLDITQGAGYGLGTYELINYGTGTSVTGDFTGWTTSGGGGGKIFTFVNNTTTGSQHEIDLVITQGTASTQWDFASGGSGDGNYGDSSKWQGNTYPDGTVAMPQTATFATGSTGEINSTNIPSGTVAINNISAINPHLGGMIFDNATVSYTLNGGNITLNNNNMGATIEVDHGSHTITSNLTVTDSVGLTFNPTISGDLLTVSGTLNNGNNPLFVAGAGNTTLNEAISGSGNLTMNGTGTLTLGAANSYGNTSVNSGTLTTATATSGGAGHGSLSMGNAIVNIGGTESISSLSTTSGSRGSLRVGAIAATCR